MTTWHIVWFATAFLDKVFDTHLNLAIGFGIDLIILQLLLMRKVAVTDVR